VTAAPALICVNRPGHCRLAPGRLSPPKGNGGCDARRNHPVLRRGADRHAAAPDRCGRDGLRPLSGRSGVQHRDRARPSRRAGGVLHRPVDRPVRPDAGTVAGGLAGRCRHGRAVRPAHDTGLRHAGGRPGALCLLRREHRGPDADAARPAGLSARDHGDVLRRHQPGRRPLRRGLFGADAGRGAAPGDDDRPQHPPRVHHRRGRLSRPDRRHDRGGRYRETVGRRPALAGGAGRDRGSGPGDSRPRAEGRADHRGREGRDGPYRGGRGLRAGAGRRGGRHGGRGRHVQCRGSGRTGPGGLPDQAGAGGIARGAAGRGAGG